MFLFFLGVTKGSVWGHILSSSSVLKVTPDGAPGTLLGTGDLGTMGKAINFLIVLSGPSDKHDSYTSLYFC